MNLHYLLFSKRNVCLFWVILVVYFSMGSTNVFRSYKMCDLFIFTTFIIIFITTLISIINITAVSSDSRPPNPKCLTAIIVFDIWAQLLILQQGMVSAQFWGKILHFVFIQFMWNIGVLRIRIWRILLNWRPHLNVKNNYWCQAFRI